MTDERRAELRRIAEAATPGPRHNEQMAAFDRETCLSLLDAADRVAAVEAEWEEDQVELVRATEDCSRYLERIATLEAELAALKGVNQ